MKTVEEFRELYDKELMPQLKDLEERRIRIKTASKAVSAIGLAIMFSPILIGLLDALMRLPGGVGGAVFGGASCCFCSGFISFPVGIIVIALANHVLTKGYAKDFKDQVIGRVVKFMDEGLTYEPNGGIPSSTYNESQLFLTKVDVYHSEDHISGTVGKTKVEFSEVHSEYTTQDEDTDGHTSTTYHTIFRGIFFVADSAKDFKGRTLVLPNTAEKTFGQQLGSFFQKHTSGRPDRMKMEDVEFEKLFVVYGTDQVESRYVLSPSLMQRMVEFKNKTGKNLYFSFVGSKVMLAIPYSKNLFEPNYSKSILDFDQVKPYFEDLTLILGIADELNLNTRI